MVRVLPFGLGLRFAAAAAATILLSACQSDDAALYADPAVASMRSAVPANLPSTQQLDDEGYPLVGAYPTSAATQLKDAEVVNERRGLQAAASVQNAAAVSTSAAYGQSIRDLSAIQKKQRAEAEAALAQRRDPAITPASAEAVLRQIEGQ
ncbi:hypothetical protein [Mangrovicella endophytica]|uniref:hypothetical protein n=1 Tax=Mangrovicella endophytica TaxID=2066697 RepID=UPI000C9DD73B|nr:hypothetical protein [Mangrovicella endophytica]